MKSISRSKNIRFILLAALGLFIIPIVNYFLLDDIEYRFNGDVLHETVYNILYYVTEIAANLLPYFCFACLVFAMFELKGGVRVGCIICCFVSLLIPYAAGVAISYLETTTFFNLWKYYLAYTALNYLALDCVIAAAILIVSFLIKRHSRRVKTVVRDKKRRHEKPRPIEAEAPTPEKVKKGIFATPVLCAAFAAAGIMAAAELVLALYDTIVFIYELMFEYYDSMNAREALSVFTRYATIFVKGAAGYVVVRLSLSALYSAHKTGGAKTGGDPETMSGIKVGADADSNADSAGGDNAEPNAGLDSGVNADSNVDSKADLGANSDAD